MLQSQQNYLKLEPYSLTHEEKNLQFKKFMNELSRYHYKNCAEYARMLDALNFSADKDYELEELPFLPVGLFKEYELHSVPKDKIVKTMTSSGTSGQRVSKIFLDKETALSQQKTLAKIVTSLTGSSRMPMMIIDCPSVLKNRAMFSARGAGILGFSIFGRKNIYALDDEMNLQIDKVTEFLQENQGKKIFLFGFTFMVWQYFFKVLRDKNIKLDLSNAVLIHGGGWKKMQEQSLTPQEFRTELKNICGITEVFNYYGMVEQTGSIFIECEHGHLHTSIFSEIITRRGKDFSVCDVGEVGIIELMSVLPSSYPGHIILTEDEGKILGEDDCPCGRKGKYFEIIGRIKQAEVRGCSDTYGQ